MDQILINYRHKIENLISLLQTEHVIFDFDGTLIEMAHGNNRLLPCADADLNEYAKDHDVYATVKPLEIMQYIVSKLDSNKVYVLTVSQPNIIEQKQRAIQRLYPTIIPSHVMHVRNSAAKYIALQQWHADTRHDVIFVDDDLKVLLKAEEGLCFVKAIHNSTFMQ